MRPAPQRPTYPLALPGNLTPEEGQLADSFVRGLPYPMPDPGDPDAETPRVTIRAEVIAGLLMSDFHPADGAVPRLRLHNATVVGQLDLAFGTAHWAADFRECLFTAAPLLEHARLRSFQLVKCDLPGFAADHAEVRGSLSLDDCFVWQGFHEEATEHGEAAETPVTTARRRQRPPRPRRLGGAARSARPRAQGFHGQGFQGRAYQVSWEYGAEPKGSSFKPDARHITDRAKGRVRLTGIHVTGQLRLSRSLIRSEDEVNAVAVDGDFLSVDRGLFLQNTQVIGETRLGGARVTGEVNLDGAALSCKESVALFAEGLTVTGDLFMRPRDPDDESSAAKPEPAVAPPPEDTSANAVPALPARGEQDPRHPQGSGEVPFTADGVLQLGGARVHGLMQMVSAHLGNEDQTAWDASGLLVTGDLDAEGVKITGDVVLDRAEVKGNGRFGGLEARRFRAESLAVGGDLGFAGGTIGDGLVLSGARVGGEAGFGHLAARRIHAESLTVGGDLRLDGVVVDERLELSGAQITGMVSFADARLHVARGLDEHQRRMRALDHGGHALRAAGLKATGDVRFTGADINGPVDLGGAEITGAVRLAELKLTCDSLFDVELNRRGTYSQGYWTRPGRWRRVRRAYNGPPALDLAGAELGELWLDPAHIDGEVDLSHANITMIRGACAVDSIRAGVRLDGLTYQQLRDNIPDAFGRFLAGRERYLPQGYEELASYHRRGGDERRARRVMLAKHRHETRSMSGGGLILLFTRVWRLLQDLVFGYGYVPLRAGLWLGGFFLVGMTLFGAWLPLGVPAPYDGPGIDQDIPAHVNADDQTVFHLVPYTLDLLLPVISIGQDGVFQWKDWRENVSYVLVAAGWVLATMIIAGLSRVLSRN